MKRSKLTYTAQLPGAARRLYEAAAFVCARSAHTTRVGETTLGEVLWHADFSAFAERGVPVTGRAYRRLADGPAPDEFASVLDDLVGAGRVAAPSYGFPGFAEAEPPVTCGAREPQWLDDDDLAFLTRAAEEVRRAQADGAERGIAWRTRNVGDLIPYESALLSDVRLDDRVSARLLPRARACGWTSL